MKATQEKAGGGKPAAKRARGVEKSMGNVVQAGRGGHRRVRGVVLAGLMAALTAVLAYVHVPVPFSPVPVSGQTLGVMLAGSLLGRRLGALSMGAYVLLGALGLPVYAGGAAGLGVLLGPTGGYLIGFVLGAWTVGWLTERHSGGERGDAGPGPGRLLVAYALGGMLVIYALGTLQLALVTGMGVREALAVGVVPFLAGDLAKVGLATILTKALDRAMII